MPSGRTHDRITLWCSPLVTGVTLASTRDSSFALLVTGGFLFSGLMFGPDLDVYSRQYQRWGWLRWGWLPYQKGMRHRSLLSHGCLIGTAIRVVYLAGLLSGLYLVGVSVWAIAVEVMGTGENWQGLVGNALSRAQTVVGHSWRQHPQYWVAGLVGLELGAMSHTLSDWGGSTLARVRSRGWQGVAGKARKPRKYQRKYRHR